MVSFLRGLATGDLGCLLLVEREEGADCAGPDDFQVLDFDAIGRGSASGVSMRALVVVIVLEVPDLKRRTEI